jgi:hypothetical protein
LCLQNTGFPVYFSSAQQPSSVAAPTFAILALWTGLFGGQPDVLCMGMQGASPLNGMALMYALMSIFHAAPWLKLIFSRGTGARRS